MGATKFTINGLGDSPRSQLDSSVIPIRRVLETRSSSWSKLGLENSPCNKMLKDFAPDDLKLVRSHTELAQTANGVRMLTKNLAKANIQLHVQAIMIVTKARDNSLIYLTREIAEWLLNRKDDIVVYVDSNLKDLRRFDATGLMRAYPKASSMLKFWTKHSVAKQPQKIDLCIALGGDGTVLYVLSLFQQIVPPVLSFALGSLGFLTNFRFEQFRKVLTTVLDDGVSAYLRMRFTCRVYDSEGVLKREQQVLNELVVDRGPSPYVTNLEIFGDGSLLTIAQADGVIIATPTGSTAYSLSAGGSLVHPGVSAISVTPICPHTLSFRPILLPDGMCLKVKVPSSSRSTAWASFDGKVRTEMRRGDYVTIQASPFPFPTVKSSKTEFIDSVSQNLNWNVREQQKAFSHYLTGNTKSAFEKSNEKNDFLEMNSNLSDEIFDIEYSDGDDISSSSVSNSPVGELDHDLDTAEYYALLKRGINGINSPSSVDNRTCYAHPNATILLIEDSLGKASINDLDLSNLQF